MNTDDAGRADLWPNAELVFIWVCGVLGYYAHAEKTTMSGFWTMAAMAREQKSSNTPTWFKML